MLEMRYLYSLWIFKYQAMPGHAEAISYKERIEMMIYANEEPFSF